MGRKGPKYLLWVDLESTGTSETSDPILEIGALLTDPLAPFEEIDSFHRIIDPDTVMWREKMDTFVLDMHTSNGLLADISAGVGVSRAEAENQMVRWMTAFGQPHQFMLAGSGVSHFDRRFIAEQLPRVEALLQYPNVDVGIDRRNRERAGRPDLIAAGTTYSESEHFDKKPHRAIDDIRDHLAEARIYAEQLQALPVID